MLVMQMAGCMTVVKAFFMHASVQCLTFTPLQGQDATADCLSPFGLVVVGEALFMEGSSHI